MLETNALVIQSREMVASAGRRLQAAQAAEAQAIYQLKEREKEVAVHFLEGKTFVPVNGELAAVEEARSLIRSATHGVEYAEEQADKTIAAVREDLKRQYFKDYTRAVGKLDAALAKAAAENQKVLEIYEEALGNLGRSSGIEQVHWHELLAHDSRLTNWRNAVGRHKDNAK